MYTSKRWILDASFLSFFNINTAITCQIIQLERALDIKIVNTCCFYMAGNINQSKEELDRPHRSYIEVLVFLTLPAGNLLLEQTYIDSLADLYMQNAFLIVDQGYGS